MSDDNPFGFDQATLDRLNSGNPYGLSPSLLAQLNSGLPAAVSNSTPSGYEDPWAWQGYYGAQGFIPGQSNKDWTWHEGSPTWAMNFNSGFTPEPTQDPSEMDILRLPGENIEKPKKLSEDDQAIKDMQDYLSNYYKGGGYWTSEKNPITNIEYSPQGGYRQWSDNPTMAGKIMSGVTMAALGAMTGGAALAAAPAGLGAIASGALAGAATGVPNAMRVGLNTGDWGRAGMSVGLGALGGGVMGGLGTYGSSLGIPQDNPVVNTALKLGTNMAKSAISGQDSRKSGLSAIANSVIGSGIKGITGVLPFSS